MVRKKAEQRVWSARAPTLPRLGGGSSPCGATSKNPLPQVGGGSGWGLSVTAEAKTRRTQPRSLASARRLRRDMTDVEQKLWHHLRQRQLDGFHFRKQCPIGPYIADFACLRVKLVIEVDGSQHADSGHDAARDAWFAARGYRVLRFWNNDVLQNMDGVYLTITAALGQVESTPNAQAH